MDGLIQVDDLHRHFEMGAQVVRALDGVSATVAAGEFVAMMGPSGSGKSTLLYLVGGLDRPTSGTIRINGQELSALSDDALAHVRGQEIGFIFQSFHLIPTMTALQNVVLPMVFAQIPATRREARARELLSLVELAQRMDHRPTELSGGQQQRVAIARALANDPRIILADEPTGNLDSRMGEEIMALLVKLNREEGRTIVIVSHDPSVADYVTRTMHLKDGRLVAGAA
jgi:putative ABC transport system ATP-binding protein